jgi:hypothetical protein
VEDIVANKNLKNATYAAVPYAGMGLAYNNMHGSNPGDWMPGGKQFGSNKAGQYRQVLDPLDISGMGSSARAQNQENAYNQSADTLRNLLYNQAPGVPNIRYGGKNYQSTLGLGSDLFKGIQPISAGKVRGFNQGERALKKSGRSISNLEQMAKGGTGLDRYQANLLQEQLKNARGQTEQQGEQATQSALSDLAQQGQSGGGAGERLSFGARLAQAQNLAKLGQEQRTGLSDIASQEAQRRYGIQTSLPELYGSLGSKETALGGQEAGFINTQQGRQLNKADTLAALAQQDINTRINQNNKVWGNRIMGEGDLAAGQQGVLGVDRGAGTKAGLMTAGQTIGGLFKGFMGA